MPEARPASLLVWRGRSAVAALGCGEPAVAALWRGDAVLVLRPFWFSDCLLLLFLCLCMGLFSHISRECHNVPLIPLIPLTKICHHLPLIPLTPLIPLITGCGGEFAHRTRRMTQKRRGGWSVGVVEVLGRGRGCAGGTARRGGWEVWEDLGAQ